MKIACDFVSPREYAGDLVEDALKADHPSPDNVQRCGQLTDEFRGENIRYSWKTDVLQYNNTLW